MTSAATVPPDASCTAMNHLLAAMNPGTRTLSVVKHPGILGINIAILHAEVTTIFLAISCYINNPGQDHVLRAAR